MVRNTITNRENFTYSPLTLAIFTNISLMFKTSYLGVSILPLCPFCTENLNGMPILTLNPKLKLRHFGNGVVLELGVKLTFFVWNGQHERKLKFDIPK